MDALHKLSYHLTICHALVALEPLHEQEMTKSARGTAAEPGANVRKKARLNHATLAVGWGDPRRQVDSRAPWNGSQLALVKGYTFTSQECGACGHIMHADVNAAKNILARGLRVTAGGALESRRATKPVARRESWRIRQALR